MQPDRRGFVKALLSVPLIGFAFPKALLGDPAGGFFAAVPLDIAPLLQWHEPMSPVNMDATVQHFTAGALWAMPGSDLASVQVFGGSIVSSRVDSPRLIAAKRENAVNSMRACLDEHHTPGWMRVTETITADEPQGYDEDGEPYFYKSVSRWRRVGYVRWINPSDLKSAVYHIA